MKERSESFSGLHSDKSSVRCGPNISGVDFSFSRIFSDEWPTRRVAYLRIVYTTTEFVGKFFSGEKKIRRRRKYLLHELFHRKNFCNRVRNFQWKRTSFQSARFETDQA